MRGRGGGGGGGGRAAAYTWQQLSAIHFISQIIKDNYRLPFQAIIILCSDLSLSVVGSVGLPLSPPLVAPAMEGGGHLAGTVVGRS